MKFTSIGIWLDFSDNIEKARLKAGMISSPNLIEAERIHLCM